jgi:hypothetical protein
MDPKEKIHEITYTLDHFSHLLSEAERTALGAFVGDVDGEQENTGIFIKGRLEPSPEVRQLLSGGMQALRVRLAEKLLQAHRSLIYEKACKKCGVLPANPNAKQCLKCGNTW